MELQGKSPETIRTYRNATVLFLNRVGDGYSDPVKINRYLVGMRNRGASMPTLRLHFYAIKWLLKTMGVSLPHDLLVKPAAKYGQKYSPCKRAFTYDEVSKIIQAANRILVAPGGCSFGVTVEEIARLALSTVFGFRVGEIASITRANFGSDGTLHIQTEKRGEERKHLLPENFSWVRESLKNCVSACSVRHLHRFFKLLLVLAGFELQDYSRYSFHAVRAAVVTGLHEAGCDAVDITLFMGWKRMPARVSPMLREYINPDIETLHERIYSRHPFIGMWKADSYAERQT